MIIKTSLVIFSILLSSPTVNKKTYVGNWIVTYNKEGVCAETKNDNDSFLYQCCFFDDGKCIWAFSGGPTCDENSQIPVLINSENGSMGMDMSCLKLGKSFLLVFSDFKKMTTSTSAGDKIGIAFPMEGGLFRVNRFALNGLSDAIEILKIAAPYSYFVPPLHAKELFLSRSTAPLSCVFPLFDII